MAKQNNKSQVKQPVKVETKQVYAPVAEIRKQVDNQIQDKQIMTASVDYQTLLRMYPRRLLGEIIKTEGYENIGNMTFKKI